MEKNVTKIHEIHLAFHLLTNYYGYCYYTSSTAAAAAVTQY